MKNYCSFFNFDHMRSSFKTKLSDADIFFWKSLHWAQQFNEIVYLNSNNYYKNHNGKTAFHTFEKLLAIRSIKNLVCNPNQSFESLKKFIDNENDWIFGHFGYDLKNETENLVSENIDFVEFPDIYFFVPEIVIVQTKNDVHFEIHQDSKYFKNHIRLFEEINAVSLENDSKATPISFRKRLSKNEYCKNVNQIKRHIFRGDIYELNYCIELYSHPASIKPLSVYEKLNALSPTPFSCFYKLHDKYLLCASMERFLKKEQEQIISQPIKGTITRSKNQKYDSTLKKKLFNDPKERAENIMIVDLVRNDLSKTAIPGSVKVDELCGIYPFSHVHQMISTVISQQNQNFHEVDVIRGSFPMGSMTGAPKIMAMKLIEQFETTRRGIFSGSVGYFTPSKNFDFNVVIRSIMYNQTNQYVSIMAGSAITAAAEAENEYKECMLKAKVLKDCLQ